MKSLLDLLDLPIGVELLYIGQQHVYQEGNDITVEIQPEMAIVKDIVIFEEDENSVQLKLASSRYDVQIYTKPIIGCMPFCDKLYLFTSQLDSLKKGEYAFKIEASKYLIGFDLFEAIEDLADLFHEYGVEVW